MVTTLEMNGSVPVMAEAAMNVIKRVYRPVDVMEVKIKDEDATKKLRPLYGLREVCINYVLIHTILPIRI